MHERWILENSPPNDFESPEPGVEDDYDPEPPEFDEEEYEKWSQSN